MNNNCYPTLNDRASMADHASLELMDEYKMWAEVSAHLCGVKWCEDDIEGDWSFCTSSYNVRISYSWDGDFYSVILWVGNGEDMPNVNTISLRSGTEKPILPPHLLAEVIKRRSKAFSDAHFLHTEAVRLRLLARQNRAE